MKQGCFDQRFGGWPRHNGKENPIGIETFEKALEDVERNCHNGKENPIGIETNVAVYHDDLQFCHNGKENPIGIETFSAPSKVRQ
ncbi:hypothetical protein Mhun_1856 [Methanospirillum hungatei JF-1]|uniref:Uncharacterized protein n=1 Tax=Methanospirillum hungatei JF-1 (strain ATCC 27890 / DSM 864 / NBRC 100397 / JF-1) TaxID=323259 RepID=Q2FQQ5_METHJ|nr:hypothetical protein Mhun_1856 [Methanospirillum hungatei JF-1]